jgi:DNA-binding GntR family transcriptional regulator
MRTRQIVECEAVRLAVENGDSAWEDAVVSSYSLLIREIERMYERETLTIARYWERHNLFHRALVSACPIAGLKGFVDDVYLRMAIYRRLTYTEGFPKDYVIKQHKTLMNAALSRDVDATVTAMTDHINGNSAILVKILTQKESFARPAAERSRNALAKTESGSLAAKPKARVRKARRREAVIRPV